MPRKKKIEEEFDMDFEDETSAEIEVVEEEQPVIEEEKELPVPEFTMTDDEVSAWMKYAWKRIVGRFKVVLFSATNVPADKQRRAISWGAKSLRRRGVYIVPDELAPVVSGMKELEKIKGYTLFSKE